MSTIQEHSKGADSLENPSSEELLLAPNHLQLIRRADRDDKLASILVAAIILIQIILIALFVFRDLVSFGAIDQQGNYHPIQYETSLP